jgi:adenine-specific DNA-methyltransferase
MARKKKSESKRPIETYEHRDKQRINNPHVGLVTPETDPDAGAKKTYAYDPHLDPQLQWAGKAEHTSFKVPTVSLHVHERIDPRTIVEAVRKKNGSGRVQLSIFENERKEPLREAIEFYKHAHGWSNRLIAGDSLLVMNSLLEKEGMAGKVQMVYLDPPYGIRYGSNFQPFVNKRDVKDGKDEDLTAEPEQIRAFRDTWELGIHSYLNYLRDRLLLARELLTASGSVFVQISDENVHHVRELMDEVFGVSNFVSIVVFRKKLMPLGAKTLETMCDFLLWYAKDRDVLRYRQPFVPSVPNPSARWTGVELSDGTRRMLTSAERKDLSSLPAAARVFATVPQIAPSFSEKSVFPFDFDGKTYYPPKGSCWVTTKKKMELLAAANRLVVEADNVRYLMFHDDFPYSKITNPWNDTPPAQNKTYVVQTNPGVIERCLLMATDPGDLVFDPTCGSGTTAFVAEQWGRRWITCDTSRGRGS